MTDDIDEEIEEEYVGIMEEWGLTFGKIWPFILLLVTVFVVGFLLLIWSALNQYGEGMAGFQG